MLSVLSTKKLSAAQKKAFCEAEIALVEYNAIKIKPVDFKMPETVENGIFTSKNAVRAVLDSSENIKKIKNCFCVGIKTATLLKKNDLKPVIIAENSTDLAQFIVKNHSEKGFYFFCGDNRREELPSILKAESIRFEEIITYKTTLNPKRFDRDFDAVLFFSPSGIQSFVKNGHFGQKTAICIGKTTAAEAKKNTTKIAIANSTTVESVIEKAIELIENIA
jgi:uroporphyrinogen-III synthase